MSQKKKIVFILSSQRSGSTWLGYVLGSAQESAFLGEYDRGWDASRRVPCSWCMANGVDPCPILGGIESVPVERAFEFAFARLNRRVLIDGSKTLTWAEKFITSAFKYDICLIHLIRDPRGWYASQRRRVASSLEEQLREWSEENSQIRSFLKSSAGTHATVFYDELAKSPHPQFKRLFTSIKLPFRRKNLNYWEKIHHGFAANGASSFLLFDRPHTDRLQHFITGDDSYYRKNKRQQFFDQRWKKDLRGDERERIENNQLVADLLLSYNRKLSAEGISLAKANFTVLNWLWQLR